MSLKEIMPFHIDYEKGKDKNQEESVLKSVPDPEPFLYKTGFFKHCNA
mgnify:CR=1 FL=1